ncbi:PQQ-binding-like beta-propeller repeat protein [Bradyrhizobium sp. RDT10]
MTRFTNHRSLMRASVLATVVAAVGLASALPARAADEVTHDRLLNADKEPANWLHHHKNFSATRFSSLKDINRDNVKNLKVAWTMHLGGVEGGGIWTYGGLEGTPIVENGFMYVTDGWGSVYKIDTHGGQGILLWKMDPKTDHDWAGAVACCGVNNRGVALWGNLVISHTLDGRLIATNKENGQVAWQRQVADPDKGEVITGAPLIVKNMAITGVAGAEYGIRGWLAATDLPTQKEAWRTFTIPGQGRAGSRHLEGRQQRRGQRRRFDMGHRHLRSRDRYHHLGHRQSRSGLGQPVSARRQSLYRQFARARCQHWKDQMALPTHAE